MVHHLAKAFSESGGSEIDAKQLRIRHVPHSDLGSRMLNVRLCRCMAHSLNLAARHFLKAFGPTPRRVLTKAKCSSAEKPAADVDQDDEIESDGEEEDGEADEDKIVDFQPGDLLGKAHAFVAQACLHFDGSCHGVSDNSHS